MAVIRVQTACPDSLSMRQRRLHRVHTSLVCCRESGGEWQKVSEKWQKTTKSDRKRSGKGNKERKEKEKRHAPRIELRTSMRQGAKTLTWRDTTTPSMHDASQPSPDTIGPCLVGHCPAQPGVYLRSHRRHRTTTSSHRHNTASLTMERASRQQCHTDRNGREQEGCKKDGKKRWRKLEKERKSDQ